MTTDIEVHTRDIIETAVLAHAPGQKIKKIEIRRIFDRDEVEGLEIELYYEPSNHKLGPHERISMQYAISDALLGSGDKRFPYLDHIFNDVPVPAK